MAAYFVAQALVFADQFLADEIVFNVKAPTVSDCHGVGTGGYVNRIRSLPEQTPCIHLLERLDSSIGVNVPIQDEPSDSIRERTPGKARRGLASQST